MDKINVTPSALAPRELAVRFALDITVFTLSFGVDHATTSEIVILTVILSLVGSYFVSDPTSPTCLV